MAGSEKGQDRGVEQNGEGWRAGQDKEEAGGGREGKERKRRKDKRKWRGASLI